MNFLAAVVAAAIIMLGIMSALLAVYVVVFAVLCWLRDQDEA